MNLELSETELRAIYIALVSSETALLSQKRTKFIIEKIKRAIREEVIHSKISKNV